MLYFFVTALSFYIILRCVLPLQAPLWVKLLLGLFLLLCGFKLQIFRLTFGSLMPELPRWFLIVSGVLHGAFMVLVILYALRDLSQLGLWLTRNFWPGLPLLPFSAGQWATGLIALALALSVLSVWQALRVPDVRHITATLPRLPAELDGLRLVQLSDLHLSRAFPQAWAQAVVQKANALKPDLIVLTGDLVDGTPGMRKNDVAPLAQLRAPLGVFVSPGNHEYYWGYTVWMDKYRSLGLRTLENEHVTLTARGQPLLLAGVTDPVAQDISRSGAGPDPAKAFKNAPGEPLRILLAHRPKLLAEAGKAGADLQLSGHTHGGQLTLGKYLVGAFNQGYLAGFYRQGESLLYVSQGTGLWGGFPLRLFTPSEITEITLRRGPLSEN